MTTTDAPGRRFVPTPHGPVHVAEQGVGDAVLLLHQTPRSWDEYRDVLPALGADFRAIAVDTLGFGDSTRPVEPWSIELFASGVLAAADALGLDRFHLVGHHTGGVIAVEVAARAPDRVDGLVLSGTPYVDAARRSRVAARDPVDHVVPAADGSHLLALWRNRAPFYPADRPDLLERFVRDALRVLDRAEEGHTVVNSYRMEDRIGAVRARTLVLCGELDDFSRPDLPRLVAAIPGAESALLPGTGVPAVDHRPEQFAAAVAAFLRGSGVPVR
jgi:pimeloyl-ACP methyl ester carboxylesterase